MGPALFCVALRPELKRFREEFGSGSPFIHGRYISRPYEGNVQHDYEALRSSDTSYTTLSSLSSVPTRQRHYHPEGRPRRRRNLYSLRASA